MGAPILPQPAFSMDHGAKAVLRSRRRETNANPARSLLILRPDVLASTFHRRERFDGNGSRTLTCPARNTEGTLADSQRGLPELPRRAGMAGEPATC